MKAQSLRRVFGKDITNTYAGQDKNQKNVNLNIQKKQQKSISLLKIQEKYLNQKKFSDPLNQYKKDIIVHMLSLQKKHFQNTNQKVTQNMRQILIDWMVDVHTSFELKQQTLHLAFNYLNQFESKASFSKQEYQLVGITCLWIASKYQEIYPPRMKNYVDVTANTYTVSQLKKMQQKILGKLCFNLNHITLLSLLQVSVDKTQSLDELQKKSIAYAKYILQMIIISDKFLTKYNPSKIISTILLVCNSVFKTKLNNKKFQEIKEYKKEQIYQCYKQIVELLKNNKQYGSNAIKRKYQSQKFYKVGKLKIQLKNQQQKQQLQKRNN